MLTVFVRSQGKVALKNFIGSGGQGGVYAKGGIAYKIYSDPKKAISQAKIDELSVLDNPVILRPLEPVLDLKTNGVIGYTMRELGSPVHLAQFLTRAFKDAHRVTPENTLALVRQFQQTVAFVHRQGILVVDLNEFNFVLDEKFTTVYFLDVDSYQTPSFPALYIMPSIRDPHSATFSTLTDWFSFAVVSFAMFIGIHPYKGTHARVHDLEDRMRRKISVFNPEVHVPCVCLPLATIPPVYLDWYGAVLEEGKRMPPPSDVRATAGTVGFSVTETRGSNQFLIEELADYGEEIVGYCAAHGGHVVLTTGKVIAGRSSLPYRSLAHVVITPRFGTILSAGIVGGQLELVDVVSGIEIPATIAVEKFMSYHGRLYMKYGAHIYELCFVETAERHVHAAPVVAANVMERATSLYAGVAVQNMLGSCYVTVFPERGLSYERHIRELDGMRIVDAKYENLVLVIVAHTGRQYNEYIVRFDERHSLYDIRTRDDVSPVGINMAVLANGIAVRITDEEEIEVFANVIGSPSIKRMRDPAIAGDIKLLHDGTMLLFARGSKLFRIRERKP